MTVEDVGIAHEGGYTAFEILHVTPNRPIMLLRRMDYARGDFEIEYSANDVRVGLSQCAGSDKRFRWRNWPFLIPAEFVTTETLKPGHTYYMRFKSCLEDNASQFFSDYFEFCPRSVYNGVEPEDIW